MPETFGNTHQGTAGTLALGQDEIFLCKYTSGPAGLLESITMFVAKDAGIGKVKFAIYDSSFNFVTNGGTEEKDIRYDTHEWITGAFGTPPEIAAATVYYLAWWSNTAIQDVHYDSGGVGQLQHQDPVVYDGWPASLTPSPWGNYAVSIYATYVENYAPTAPTSLLCEGEEAPTEITDLAPEFSAVYNDPNAEDQANAFQIQVGTTPGASDIWDSDWIADLTQEGQRCPDQSYLGLPLLLQGTKYYWRIRFRDEGDAEGAWSVNAEFTMYKSLVPTAPTDTKITAPLCFAARFNDPDSASSSAYEVHVSSSLDLLDAPDTWDSGWQAENTIEGDLCIPHLYAGSPLTFEEKYYWKIRFKDEGGNAGLWSHPRWFIFRQLD